MKYPKVEISYHTYQLLTVNSFDLTYACDGRDARVERLTDANSPAWARMMSYDADQADAIGKVLKNS